MVRARVGICLRPPQRAFCLLGFAWVNVGTFTCVYKRVFRPGTPYYMKSM